MKRNDAVSKHYKKGLDFLGPSMVEKVIDVSRLLDFFY
jgi:hypothetical protein